MTNKALSDTTPTFTYLNKATGLLETIDARTGELLAVQSTPDPMAIKGAKATVVKYEGRDILVEPGVSLDRIGHGHRPHKWVYSDLMADLICQRIAEGETLTKIVTEEGMPPTSAVSRWRKENKKFDEAMRQAFRLRAEYHRDKVIDIAEEECLLKDSQGNVVLDKNDEPIEMGIDNRKLRIDAHKWAAGTDNADRFGSKTKVDVDVKPILHFVVDTGIRRPDDPGYNKDQTKIVQDIQRAKDIEAAQAVEIPERNEEDKE